MTTAAIRAESFSAFARRIGAYRDAVPATDQDGLAVTLNRDAILDLAVARYWRVRFPQHRHGAFLVSPTRTTK